jgi:hypothetical protein
LELGEANTLPSQDSLGVLVGQAFFFFRLEPIRGTYDALIGSGDLQLIRSSEVRAQLANLFGSLGDGFEDEELSTQMRAELIMAVSEVAPSIRLTGAAVRSLMGLRPVTTELPFAELLPNPRFLSALFGVAFPEMFVLDQYFLPIREELVEMLHLIEEELLGSAIR